MAERTKVVEVVPYNPEWTTEFEQIKTMIMNYIGDLILAVEHVGSTSIEGLSAKPIIDLDVVMDSYDVLPDIIERLEKVGFEYQGNLGIEGREAFKRTHDDGLMKYHLYVCPKDGKGYVEHIAFRDYLRANESARKDYETLKLILAETYRYDIDNYCDKKTEFVKDILRLTLLKPYSYPQFETSRLLLRELTLEYTNEVFALFSDPVIVKFMDIEPCHTRQEAEEIISFHLEDTGTRWGIFLKEENRFIGTCGYHCLDMNTKAEIGFDLAQEYWGKGYMQEALAPVIDFGLNQMNLVFIEATVDVENTRSQRLLEKLSFIKAEELKDNLFYYRLHS